MVNVSHDRNDRGTELQFIFTVLFIFLFHFHLLLHIDEFDIESEFTGHKFDYFRIETLVDGHHDTEAHTFADHFRKTYIHQVGEFAHADKFRYLQFVIHRIAHGIRHFLAFFPAVFGLQALALTTTTGKLGLRFLDLPLNFFLVNEFIFPTSKYRTGAATVRAACRTTTTTLESASAAARTFVFFFINEDLPFVIFFLNRDTLPFFLLVFHRTGIIVHRQFNLTEDLGTCQFFYFNILNHSGLLLFCHRCFLHRRGFHHRYFSHHFFLFLFKLGLGYRLGFLCCRSCFFFFSFYQLLRAGR